MPTTNPTATATYLRHHLLGAGTIISIVADRAADGDQPWTDLHDELVWERDLVASFLEQLDRQAPPIEQVAGFVGKAAVRAKLALDHRITPGIDDLLEFELIRTGIEGKKCLWRLLRELSHAPFDGVDFTGLLGQADRQAEAVEARRIAAGRSSLTTKAGQRR